MTTPASNTTPLDDRSRSEVALPVLSAKSPGRMGRRRAIVLAIVQLLIIVHIVTWVLSREYGWFGGATITPIEPSEGMEFGKNGVINAGLIFFVLALLSTLVLGRWFCGWGCHVILLQDLCLWMLRKVKIRPRPFRSRLLLWGPLIIAVYMFIWPAFYRLVLAPFIQPNLGWPGFSVHLTTHDFWATFPGASIAVIFLFICGFATVYFLGGKGFCTYGCPYGGFFAPLDRFAPGSIRLAGDCDECGKCTAACTSNVRVHEEVRTWGMVTDPGCMKTMDCVAICPDDALRFGFGKSAAATTKGTPKAEPVPPKWDLSWPEEWACAAICLLAFLAYRGVYASVPLLMAMGMAPITTFLLWKTWRILTTENVHLHRWQLKLRGRLRTPGVVYLGLMVVLVAFTVQSGVVNWIGWGAMRTAQDLGTSVAVGQPLDAAQETRARTAVDWLDRVTGFQRGGVGLTTDPNHDRDAARLLALLGEYDSAAARLAPVVSAFPDDLNVRRMELHLKLLSGDQDQVQSHLDSLSVPPAMDNRLRLDVVEWNLSAGRIEVAETMVRPMVEGDSAEPGAMKLLAVILINTDRREEGETMIRRYLDAAPEDAYAWITLGQVLTGMDGGRSEADQAIEQALELGGQDPAIVAEAVRYYVVTGRELRARELDALLRRLTGN
jgi:polyferredoxin/Flp pilus assembly protein TadD